MKIFSSLRAQRSNPSAARWIAASGCALLAMTVMPSFAAADQFEDSVLPDAQGLIAANNYRDCLKFVAYPNVKNATLPLGSSASGEMMKICKDSGISWHAQCVRAGNDEGDCTAQAMILPSLATLQVDKAAK